MLGSIKKALQKKKYGEEIIVVSGLPRSGTSMMMKMLEAAGLPIMTDSLRTADEDNPKGYYEDERVKDLDKVEDKSWVREARGKVLKVVSPILPHLPPENFYRIIFMRRSLDEVLASQNKMLDHRGEENPAEDEKMKENYRKHLRKVEVMVFRNPNVEVLEVDYGRTVNDPLDTATKVVKYLGLSVEPEKMAAVVDESLYRNRAPSPSGRGSG